MDPGIGEVACEADVSAIHIFRLSTKLAYIVMILHTSRPSSVKGWGRAWNHVKAPEFVHGDISMGEFRRASDAAGDK